MFKDKIVYQIYPKSFYDTNGDGIGDLKGVCEKLDYLQLLGIDYIWLNPFFVSPQKDNGYDVADYRSIDPMFGTMEDLDHLIAEAAKRNIGLMFDMVFNHTSTQHEWFQKALAGEQKFKDYYFFKKGNNQEPPTNWISKFGGNAWEYVAAFDEYYLHLFDKTQADLNWENEDVKKELVSIVNFWIEKGVKGFRFDVVNLISKPDVFEDDFEGDGRRFYTDGKRVHEYLKYLNENTFKDKDFITVGEMSSTTIDHCARYSGEDEHELAMVFNFHHLKVDYKEKQKWSLMDFDFMELKQLFNDWQVGMQDKKGWNALFWNCHDQPRSVSRFGNDTNYHKESAKMLATALHMMRGTPYIYQGEEIGMTNANFSNISEYRDVESTNYYEILKAEAKSEEETMAIIMAKSRDNARTLMQWNTQENAGFSNVKPWIEANKNYVSINVEESLKDENSIFYYYQKLIQLRKKYKVISEGMFEPVLQSHKQVFAYKRHYRNQEVLVLNNFYDKPCSITLHDTEGYTCILSNYDAVTANETMVLKPYESCVFYRDNKAHK